MKRRGHAALAAFAHDQAGEPFELEPEQSTIRILIGQATADLVGDHFVLRHLGEHVLKGKGEPVTIHRVLGRRGEPAP